IGGIVFAIFVLLVLGMPVGSEVWQLVRLHRIGEPSVFYLLGSFWLAELITMLLVIQQTWRRTILDASGEGLCLVFTSPFRTQRFQWPADAVVEIRVPPMGMTKARETLGQVEIFLTSGQTLHLFTDHAKQELDWYASQIADTLGRGPGTRRE